MAVVCFVFVVPLTVLYFILLSRGWNISSLSFVCIVIIIKSRWRHNWKSAQVVNSHLVCDPTIRQPGFDLPWQQWSLLNCFRTEQGHCGACRRKWRLSDTDLCPCSETQTMSHIVEYCHLTKLNGGLSRLHSADEDAVSWLTNYGKWHAYEKKKKGTSRPAAVISSTVFDLDSDNYDISYCCWSVEHLHANS